MTLANILLARVMQTEFPASVGTNRPRSSTANPQHRKDQLSWECGREAAPHRLVSKDDRKRHLGPRGRIANRQPLLLQGPAALAASGLDRVPLGTASAAVASDNRFWHREEEIRLCWLQLRMPHSSNASLVSISVLMETSSLPGNMRETFCHASYFRSESVQTCNLSPSPNSTTHQNDIYLLIGSKF